MKRWKVRVTKYVNDCKIYDVESINLKTKKIAIEELLKQKDKMIIKEVVEDNDNIDSVRINDYKKINKWELLIYINVAMLEPNEIKIVGEIIKE